ncbi:MAG: ApaG domain [Chthoniobacterales bacterium]|nr:ApaG domain [Chthoniobacterales bacterium]
MPQKPRLLPGFTATLDRLFYDPERGATLEKPHLFIYFITIHNKSDQALTVKGRKWVVREANGEVMALEGEGVVGSFPHLKPGEKFSYNSCHTTHGAAIAEGSYLGLTDLGEAVIAPIPSFELVPE